MPYWQFQMANFSSALVWSATLLLFGDILSKLAGWFWGAI
jgi:membrane protein DedA with SNARE-associated domain